MKASNAINLESGTNCCAQHYVQCISTANDAASTANDMLCAINYMVTSKVAETINRESSKCLPKKSDPYINHSLVLLLKASEEHNHFPSRMSGYQMENGKNIFLNIIFNKLNILRF